MTSIHEKRWASTGCVLGVILLLGSSGLWAAPPVPRLTVQPSGHENGVAIVEIMEIALSRDDRFELLDRAQIDRTLAEQDLILDGLLSAQDAYRIGQLYPCDIFVEVHSSMDEDGISMVSFDVETGIRLDDYVIPSGTNLDAMSQELGRRVDIAMDKWLRVRHQDNLQCVSFMSARNVNLPPAFEHIPETLATLIEKELIKSPDIALLERRRMEAINQESALSEDRRYRLLTSAMLMEFDVQHAPEANGVVIACRLSRVDGTPVALVEKTGDFSFGLVQDITAEIAEKMHAAPPFDHQMNWAGLEANRLIAEAIRRRAINDSEGMIAAKEAALALIEAALATEPGDMDKQKKRTWLLLRRVERQLRSMSTTIHNKGETSEDSPLEDDERKYWNDLAAFLVENLATAWGWHIVCRRTEHPRGFGSHTTDTIRLWTEYYQSLQSTGKRALTDINRRRLEAIRPLLIDWWQDGWFSYNHYDMTLEPNAPSWDRTYSGTPLGMMTCPEERLQWELRYTRRIPREIRKWFIDTKGKRDQERGRPSILLFEDQTFEERKATRALLVKWTDDDPCSEGKALAHFLGAWLAHAYPSDFPDAEKIVRDHLQAMCALEIDNRVLSRSSLDRYFTGDSTRSNVPFEALRDMLAVAMETEIDRREADHLQSVNGLLWIERMSAKSKPVLAAAARKRALAQIENPATRGFHNAMQRKQWLESLASPEEAETSAQTLFSDPYLMLKELKGVRRVVTLPPHPHVWKTKESLFALNKALGSAAILAAEIDGETLYLFVEFAKTPMVTDIAAANAVDADDRDIFQYRVISVNLTQGMNRDLGVVEAAKVQPAQLAVGDRYASVATDAGAMLFPLSGAAALHVGESQGLPMANITAIRDVQGHLYAGCNNDRESMVFSFDPETSGHRIIAASSRAQTESGLDNCSPYTVKSMQYDKGSHRLVFLANIDHSKQLMHATRKKGSSTFGFAPTEPAAETRHVIGIRGAQIWLLELETGKLSAGLTMGTWWFHGLARLDDGQWLCWRQSFELAGSNLDRLRRGRFLAGQDNLMTPLRRRALVELVIEPGPSPPAILKHTPHQHFIVTDGQRWGEHLARSREETIFVEWPLLDSGAPAFTMAYSGGIIAVTRTSVYRVVPSEIRERDACEGTVTAKTRGTTYWHRVVAHTESGDYVFTSAPDQSTP